MYLTESITEQEFNMLQELYVDSFPPEERRPTEAIIPSDSPEFAFYAIKEDSGSLLGLISLWRFAGFNYVEHFAINTSARNSGLGSKVLALIPEPIVLEVEPAESNPMAERRIGFYKRNGFRVLDHKYIQPPYSPGLSPVELRLMVKGDLSVSADEVEKTLHRRVYKYGLS